MFQTIIVFVFAISCISKDPEGAADYTVNNCLLSYSTKLDTWLTGSKAATLMGKPAEKAKFTYSKAVKNPAYQNCKYVWKTGRIVSKEIGGSTFQVPEQLVLGFGELQTMELTQFLQTYRAVTEEEMAMAKNKTAEALDKQSGNEKLDQLADKADQTGLEKQEQKKAANSLLNAIGEVSKAYVTVNGIGDAAVWNTITQKLYVLSKGVKFSVLVELENAAENKSKAIVVAKEFLRACP